MVGALYLLPEQPYIFHRYYNTAVRLSKVHNKKTEKTNTVFNLQNDRGHAYTSSLVYCHIKNHQILFPLTFTEGSFDILGSYPCTF